MTKHLRMFSIVVVASVLLVFVISACSNPGQDSEFLATQQMVRSEFQISSSEFTENRPRKRIPEKHTCYGDDVSPPLVWSGATASTQSYALIAEDVDHETGIWVLWVLYNIPVETVNLSEGLPTSTDIFPNGITQGTNDNKNIGYNGPCPKRSVVTIFRTVQDSPHRSYFRLYALDSKLQLPSGVTKDKLLSAMEGHILDETDTYGKYMPAPEIRYSRDFLRTAVAERHKPTPTP